jgi:Methyltransferase FkbM domain
LLDCGVASTYDRELGHDAAYPTRRSGISRDCVGRPMSPVLASTGGHDGQVCNAALCRRRGHGATMQPLHTASPRSPLSLASRLDLSGRQLQILGRNMFVSYAQNFEDVMLRRALRHVARGFYIDIGAHDPLIDSVSLCFYETGWRGLHVEPTAAFADKLRAARPDEEVIQAAVSAQDENCTFYEIPETGLSTGSRTIAKQHAKKGFEVRAKHVRCIRLSAILGRRYGARGDWKLAAFCGPAVDCCCREYGASHIGAKLCLMGANTRVAWI